MPSARFDGHFPVTYPDYRDADTGATLTAVPGESYTVFPTVPGDGRWSIPAPKPRKRPAAVRAPSDPPAAKTAPSPESEG